MNLQSIILALSLIILSTTTINGANNTPSSSTVFSRVESPDIPSSIKFADKTIDLDRTDMYERLDRELTSMIYTHGNTLLVLKRANRYFPELVPILKRTEFGGHDISGLH